MKDHWALNWPNKYSFFIRQRWLKVIKALHGEEGGFDNQGCNFNGTWFRIVGSSNYLHSKGIIPANSFHFQADSDMKIYECTCLIRHSQFNQDYMLFDPFINEVADLHYRQRDMRLDVDNMSYEELLAPKERIRDVKTGLTEDVILKSMKQRKHMLFMGISIFWSHAAYVGSPAEGVIIAAATVSSQQAIVKGESSPIKRLSDVWSISESWMVNVGIEEKTPMEFRRKRTTSSCVSQQ
ncbi:hypothetical protein Tco_0092207 [Tanacetum coccineum]